MGEVMKRLFLEGNYTDLPTMPFYNMTNSGTPAYLFRQFLDDGNGGQWHDVATYAIEYPYTSFINVKPHVHSMKNCPSPIQNSLSCAANASWSFCPNNDEYLPNISLDINISLIIQQELCLYTPSLQTIPTFMQLGQAQESFTHLPQSSL